MHGQWRTIEIAGKGADVYEPQTSDAFFGAVLHLHGHGGKTLKDNPVFSAELDRWNLPCICPHGKRCWWTETVCPEFDPGMSPIAFLRTKVVPWIEEQWGAAPPRIGLTGISMGGQGALQLAYRYPREFPVLAAISPSVDFHNWYGQGLPLDEMFSSRESARQQTVTLHLHPLNWPRHQLLMCDPADEQWYEGIERLVGKLYSLGVPFEADLETTVGGHSWDYFNKMAEPALRFVAEHLGQRR